MARKRREYDDDDGRIIADMSGVPGSVSPNWMGQSAKREEKERIELHPGQEPYSPMERLRYTWAALKAGLLIGLAFIVGLGLTILILMLLWGAF